MEVQKKIIPPNEEVMKFQKRIAMVYLEYFRGSAAMSPKYLIELLQSGVQNGEFTLEDVGTSEEELREFQINDCKRVAQEELAVLREGTEDYSIILRNIQVQVQKGGFTLEDIGTSEQELEELRVKCSRILAQKYLESLRLGVIDPELYIDYLETGVQRGRFTLKEMETNEEELENLRYLFSRM